MCYRDQYTCPSEWNFSSGELGKGSFGQGGTSPQIGSAGGGSGYFGGGSSLHVQTGGGGSSYISGHNGCVSIKESSTVNSISFVNDSNGIACNDENSTGYNALGYNTDLSCNKHYSGYTFNDTIMIDGKGYSWDENGVGDTVVGMPSHDGRTTMIGNTGNGYAKITLIEKMDTYKISYNLDGGTLKNSRNTYSEFDDDITLKEPTKEGYTFTGWTGGKNLLDITNVTGSYKITTVDDGFKLVANSNIDDKDRRVQFTFKKSLEPGDYTFSFNVIESNINLNNLKFNLKRLDSSDIKQGSISNNTLHIDEKAYYLYLFIDASEPTGNEITLSNVQMEKGTERTTYEPYITTPTKNLTIPSHSKGNRNYIANWKQLFTTTYNGNGGTSFTNTVIEGETSNYYPISLQENKIFKGWFTSSENGTFLKASGFNYSKNRTVYANWLNEETIEEGNAIVGVQSLSYTTFSYDESTKEYIVTQNVPEGMDKWRGNVNFNYFGTVPYNYRYYVSMEIYAYDNDYTLYYDLNNSCDGCTGNDQWSNPYVIVNNIYSNLTIKRNQWNTVYITYDNTRESNNPNKSSLKDYTGFRLTTNNEISFKVRNIKYSYSPIE